MDAAIKHYTSVALCFARLAIQRQLEYPLFLVSWLIMIPVQYFGGIWMLEMLVRNFHPLAGWTFAQLSFVYGLGLLSHGLMVIFFIQTWGIDGFVVHGLLDRLLLRPLNVFFHFSVLYINFIGIIDLILGTIIFAYGCRQVAFVWTSSNTIKVILVVLGGMLIRAAIYTATGSIAFWTKRSRSLVGFNLTLMERTTFYPLAIYPYLLQVFLTFVIPLGFITFYPACEFLGQDDRLAFPMGLALWTPLVGLLAFRVAVLIFNWGLKRYESAGS